MKFTALGIELNMTDSEMIAWCFANMRSKDVVDLIGDYIVCCATSGFRSQRISMYRFNHSGDIVSNSGIRIRVCTASFLQADLDSGFSQINFDLDFSGEDPDVYVFCLCKAIAANETYLNLDNWDFFVIPGDVMGDFIPHPDIITLESVDLLCKAKVDYFDLPRAIVESGT